MLHEAITAGRGNGLPFIGPLPDVFERLRTAVLHDFPGRIALVSSFGAESIVLLDMIARINRATPILFNQTGMLFSETLAYQKQVAQELGLTNIRLVRPTLLELGKLDPGGTMHERDPDACCDLRKVKPLKRALQPFAAWITGRKRFQSSSRAALSLVERDDEGRMKLNPLAECTPEDIRRYIAERDLPPHPLVKRGFPSIGCAPCTTRVAAGEGPRAGRWRGISKQECGIHFVNGRAVRVPAGEA
jgi:phosphoadenosine phosphosulfate reductase